MAGFNISLSLNERKSRSDKKHNKSSRLVLFIPFRCCFAGSLPFSLSTVKQTKLHCLPLHFRNVFHFFSEKNSLSKTVLVECVRSGAASCNKRREFWCETHTPLWLLSTGRIIFLTREKTSFAILIGRIIFSRMKTIVRSSDWLELICTKIYDIAFW